MCVYVSMYLYIYIHKDDRLKLLTDEYCGCSKVVHLNEMIVSLVLMLECG